MVHEQADLVFTIPFNLLESGDSKGADSCPVDLFTSDAENQTLLFPSPTRLFAIILYSGIFYRSTLIKNHLPQVSGWCVYASQDETGLLPNRVE